MPLQSDVGFEWRFEWKDGDGYECECDSSIALEDKLIRISLGCDGAKTNPKDFSEWVDELVRFRDAHVAGMIPTKGSPRPKA